MKAKLIFLLILLLSFSILFSDVVNYDKVIRNLKGVKSYEKEDFENSEDSFKRNAIKYPKDARLHFNQANAQVKNGMLEEAEQNYKLALNNEKFKDRSKALQNLGNVKFMQKDYKNAIKNFRDALVEDSQNLDARYNYELAARMLQRQQEQKQQQEQPGDPEKEEPSDYAKGVKDQADSAVARNQYREAYNIMNEGLKVDETVSAYQKFIERLGKVANIKG